MLNSVRDLRDSSRSAAGWKKLLSRGMTLGLESEYLREAVWLQSHKCEKSSEGVMESSDRILESWFMILLKT